MNDELTDLVRKIHRLLELLAEEKIAQRDAKQRAELRQIVGNSPSKRKSVFLMDGTRSHKDIYSKAGVQQSHFSVMIGKLHKANLLEGDTKAPKLSITIPTSFFENDD